MAPYEIKFCIPVGMLASEPEGCFSYYRILYCAVITQQPSTKNHKGKNVTLRMALKPCKDVQI